MAKNRQQRIDERNGFLFVLSVYFHNPLLFYRYNIDRATYIIHADFGDQP